MKMTPERWQRVNELFEAALQRSPEDRVRFLNEACAADDELRSQVVSLLAHHEEADAEEFLDEPRPDAAQRQPVGRRRFPIRLNCPHCRNPIAILEGSPDEDVVCPSCGSSFRLDEEKSVSWSPDKLPKLEKFELLEAVGRGAFGTVYRARDTELDRIVAVKVPRSGSFAAKEDEDRFVREARSVAQLTHAGIVPVYEVGRSDAFPYIVTEFVDGITLSDALTRYEFSFREAAELVANIAEALDEAHRKGVVHRDLKPSNIMLEWLNEKTGMGARETTTGSADSTGNTAKPGSSPNRPARRFRPRLMDFGLALREEGEVTVTVDGQVLGTPAYMSPEQARGEGHRVDRRTDIYSLGAILYELLVGEQPFRGNARMLIHQVIHDEPRSPRRLNDHITRDLETICLKCLEKDPARRYTSAMELADDLRQWLRGEPIRARPIGRAARAWRWCRRNPVIASLTSTAALLLMLVAVVTTVGYVQTRAALSREAEQRQLADANAEKALLAQQQAESASRRESRARLDAEQSASQMRRMLYFSDMQTAVDAKERRGYGLIRELLVRHLPTQSQEDLRGFEWYHLWWYCHGNAFSIPCGAAVKALAISPDGRYAAITGFETKSYTHVPISIWDLRTRRRIDRLYANPRFGWQALTFTPDGKSLLAGKSGGALHIWNWPAGTFRKEIAGLSSLPTIACSPNGRIVAIAAGYSNQFIQLYELATGELLKELHPGRGSVWCLDFSPDGKLLASSHGHGMDAVKVWDVDRGVQLHDFLGHSEHVFAVAFSPDGRFVASGSGDKTVRLWDLNGGKEATVLNGHVDSVYAVRFSPDGKTLFTGGNDNVVLVWDTYDFRLRATLRGHTHWIKSLAVSADGKLLLSGSYDHTTKAWDLTNLPEEVIDTGFAQTIFAKPFVFSRNGRWIIATRFGGVLSVWEAASGRHVRDFAGEHPHCRCLAVSPDGNLLASGGSDQKVRIWDIQSGELVHVFEGFEGWVDDVAFSPTGKTVATASRDKRVRLWDSTTGEQLFAARLMSWVGAVDFSNDGDYLVAGTSTDVPHVWRWNARTFEDLGLLYAHDNGVTSIAVSPLGSIIASASKDYSINLADIRSGEILAPLQGHSRTVQSVAFSPDGRVLASASDDGTVRLWDASDFRVRVTLTGKRPFRSVRFSPTGNILAASDEAGVITIWHALDDSKADPNDMALAKLDTYDAVAIYEHLIQNDGRKDLLPDLALSVWQRGFAAMHERDLSRAVGQLSRAIKLVEDFPKHDRSSVDMYVLQNCYQFRAICRYLQKEPAQASRDLQEALRLLTEIAERFPHVCPPSTHARGLNWLALVWAAAEDDSIRNGQLALMCATQACELTHWEEHWGIDTLAAAHAELGDFAAARKWQEKAIDLSPEKWKPVYHGRATLYEQGEKYRLSGEEMIRLITNRSLVHAQ